MRPPNPVQLWRERSLDRGLDAQIARVEASLPGAESGNHDEAPVLFFNASTRIHRLSLNAAYSLLASWALRAQGHPARYLVCDHGMQQCILGARPNKPSSPPPCRACLKVSHRLFPDELVVPFTSDITLATHIETSLEGVSIRDMMQWTLDGIPLGQLVLPGLRWVMRRHHLQDDDPTRALYRRYLGSSVSLVRSFSKVLEEVKPRAVVIFNGVFYPEALLRHMAAANGIPVSTHEVGMQPFSAFFSHQEATFREIEIDTEQALGEDEAARLDRYLESRYQGEFSMAGIQFWESMRDIPPEIQTRVSRYSTAVPIFTNVVFDTSQVHANTLFSDMFAWLDQLIEVIDTHPQVLFFIRAHPDEDRPGKASEESVSDWVKRSGVDKRPNVIFIAPGESINSYKLIEQSKFVLVYNSSIGLEASLLGKPVLCAGRARYTQADTVYFPGTQEAYWHSLGQMLSENVIPLPEYFRMNARKFIYHELFCASLDLSRFLDVDPTLAGMVTFKEFNLEEIRKSPSLNTITQGVLGGGKFILER